MRSVQVNGELIAISEEHATLSALLTAQGYDAERVAVERNGELVPRRMLQEIVLGDADVLEIVSFVGGG